MKTAMCGVVASVLLTTAACGSSSLVGAGGTGGQARSGAAGAAGGASGAGGQAGSGAAGNAACPLSIDFHDGTIGGLQLGPHNHVFLDPTIDTQPVMNYESEVIFPGPTLNVVADFSQNPNIGSDSGTDVAADAGALDAGGALDPWLGELSLLPSSCGAPSLLGKTVHVRMLWVLNGAIGTSPVQTVALGTMRNGVEVQYDDAQLAYPGTRSLNTLTAIDLAHTFGDPQDGTGGVFFRIYLVDPIEGIRTTVYLDSISWTDAASDGGAAGG